MENILSDQYNSVQANLNFSPENSDINQLSYQIKIYWGNDLIHVDHISSNKSFTIGEDIGCNYYFPTNKLNLEKLQLVSGFNDHIMVNGLDQQFKLNAGEQVKIKVLNFSFVISLENPYKNIINKLTLDRKALMIFGLSLVTHLSLLTSLFFYLPTLEETDDERISSEKMILLQQYLNAAAEKEVEKETNNLKEASTGGDIGTRTKGSEGSMGSQDHTLNKRYSIAGPANNPDPHLAREKALREAMNFGIIGLLNSGMGGDVNAPTAPWGRDESLGKDLSSNEGNMWASDIGKGYGMGGLGLSGIGESGGGNGEGIGLSNIGGLGNNINHGFSSGRSLPDKYVPKSITMRQGVTTSSGRIPAEIIQRIIRQNYGRFKICYENGLRNNPNLSGRVAVRFVINREGAVGQSANGGSDLPDSGVVSCIVRAFNGLSFPAPENGTVNVTYAIQLSPN